VGDPLTGWTGQLREPVEKGNLVGLPTLPSATCATVEELLAASSTVGRVTHLSSSFVVLADLVQSYQRYDHMSTVIFNVSEPTTFFDSQLGDCRDVLRKRLPGP
jgi:hypothetical protein